MTMRVRVLRTALLIGAMAVPSTAWTAPATPACSDLATNPRGDSRATHRLPA